MKIVIDIPEEVLNSIKTFKGKFICENDYDLIQGIKNGKPLPKGHGCLRIMSEDYLREHLINFDNFNQKFIGEVDLSNATVAIIEADEVTE